jgi:hypothetical protein
MAAWPRSGNGARWQRPVYRRLPAVLRPRFGTGGIDPRLVHSAADAEAVLAGSVADDGRPREYLVEEATSDHAVSVASVVQDGDVTCVGISGTLDADLTERVLRLERAALAALAIRHGVTRTEVALTRDGPCVIEVSGHSAGVDLLRVAMRLAVGERFALDSVR